MGNNNSVLRQIAKEETDEVEHKMINEVPRQTSYPHYASYGHETQEYPSGPPYGLGVLHPPRIVSGPFGR